MKNSSFLPDCSQPAFNTKGYADIAVSGGVRIGIIGGFFIDQATGAEFFYLGVGEMTPGLGLSGALSSGTISPGTWSWQLQAAFGASVSFGSDSDASAFYEVGISTPGASLMAYYTFPQPVFAPALPTSDACRAYWRLSNFENTSSIPWATPSDFGDPSQFAR